MNRFTFLLLIVQYITYLSTSINKFRIIRTKRLKNFLTLFSRCFIHSGCNATKTESSAHSISTGALQINYLAHF